MAKIIVQYWSQDAKKDAAIEMLKKLGGKSSGKDGQVALH